MKKIVMTMGLLLAVGATCLPAGEAFSQNYWVVETDKTNNSIVRIYNTEHQLVSESKAGRRIDITKKKERRMLDKLVKQNEALARIGKR